MQTIQANFTASISELKKSPAQILKQAGDNVVAILNHNVPSAYLVPSTVYEKNDRDNRRVSSKQSSRCCSSKW